MNEARLLEKKADGYQTLELEMQSGDVITIEAKCFQIGREEGLKETSGMSHS